MLKALIDYLVHNLGIQENAAATIILTLFTFTLGFIITWCAAGVIKWKKKIRYRKILKIIIKDFLNSCEKQYLYLESFTDHKGFLYGEDYIITLQSNFSQNYLAKLDISIFIENFSSIFKKDRAIEVSKLFELIETVKTTKESLKEQMSFFYLKYEENLKAYNENLNTLRKIHDDLALEYNGKTVEQSLGLYIRSITETYKNWENNGANTFINTTHTEIVNPLFTAAKAPPPNPVSRKIIDNCIECRTAVENIKNVEEHMKTEIKAVKEIHKNAFHQGMLIVNKW